MEGMVGHGSSRLGARARKGSVEHMVRACSTNQPILRLSIGSLALITSTHWAPGCPSKLLRQRGWAGEEAQQNKKIKKRERGEATKGKPSFRGVKDTVENRRTDRNNERRVRVFEGVGQKMFMTSGPTVCTGGGPGRGLWVSVGPIMQVLMSSNVGLKKGR